MSISKRNRIARFIRLTAEVEAAQAQTRHLLNACELWRGRNGDTAAQAAGHLWRSYEAAVKAREALEKRQRALQVQLAPHGEYCTKHHPDDPKLFCCDVVEHTSPCAFLRSLA